MQKIGLGKGLSALIPDKDKPQDEPQKEKKQNSPPTPFIEERSIEEIKPNPNQTRKKIRKRQLIELADSIRIHGILQPLIIDKKGVLISGQRRLKAAKLAGLKTVPVVIKRGDAKTSLEMSIVENVQREGLHPLEKAKGYKLLMSKFGLGVEEVALRLGKKRSTVSNCVRLLNLPLEVQQGLWDGKIAVGHAKWIVGLEDPNLQITLYREAVEKNFTINQVRKWIYRKSNARRHTSRLSAEDAYLKEIAEKLRKNLSTRIQVKKTGRVGKIVIEFYSDEELEGILEKICK